MRDLTGLLCDSTADQYNPMQNAADIEKPTAITNKSGYLFERKNGRVYQSWSRKYYSISNGELTSVSRNPKTKDEDGVQTYNLRVCSVKYSDSYDRRFCFEVISPNRVLVLQAENENDMNEWIQSIRTASQLALNSDEKPRYSQPSPNLRKASNDMAIESASVAKTVERQDGVSNKEAVEKIRLVPGNDKCADCKEDSPEWACTNLGIIVMLQLGNEVGNSIYEESVPAHLEEFRIDPSSHRNDRDLWIIEKYVKRSFVRPAEVDQATLDKNFWNSIAENSLQNALRYLAQGANVDYRNTEEGLKTALHKAVDNNNEVAVEFLLQRPSDVDEKDERGWTALHYAAANNNVRLVLTLLKRHAKADIADNSNMVSLERCWVKRNA
ncbi:ankyrin [Rhizopus microsporus]|uniref:Ankyrin n=1 Tax=Rhizopus microsporus TaxID=58291 RepID=A0A1X0S2W7_RHIZD|nr:ankyrin [Rhizopus microsporus]